MKCELQLHFIFNSAYFIIVLNLLEASLDWIEWIDRCWSGKNPLFSEICQKRAILLKKKKNWQENYGFPQQTKEAVLWIKRLFSVNFPKQNQFLIEKKVCSL